jgi:hypothetical protein
MRLVGFLKGFGMFWYEFIVGDDWKIACAVVVALGVAAALVVSTAVGDTVLVVLAVLLLVAGFATAVLVDVRQSSGRSH